MYEIIVYIITYPLGQINVLINESCHLLRTLNVFNFLNKIKRENLMREFKEYIMCDSRYIDEIQSVGIVLNYEKDLHLYFFI